MAVHFWCIVAAWFVVYAGKLPVAAAMHKAGGYDNHHPRSQQAALTGWGARSLAAHLNGFETFAPFAAAVLHEDATAGWRLGATAGWWLRVERSAARNARA